MNISMLTSGHYPFDDRIYYHMARSLSDHMNNVEIVSSKISCNEVANDIKLNCFAGDNISKSDKLSMFAERLSEFKPEVIICSEPLTVLAAKRYSKKQPGKIRIIYDITEWYPSGKNLVVHKMPVRWFYFMKFLLFNLWVSGFADSFIFGEWYKSRPYRLLFPKKPSTFISYYPDLKYIGYCEPNLQNEKLRLCYSGKISMEKGYRNFFEVLHSLAKIRGDIKIEVKIIGWYESAKDKEECENYFYSDNQNISLKRFEKQTFKDFIELIKETDIFLDLRSDNFENRHCLPIKLFYYAALGRPVIFTDLKAIRKEIEINKFGFLVNPEKKDQVISLLLNYINDRELYYKYCDNARYLSETKFNWQIIEPHFLKFVISS